MYLFRQNTPSALYVHHAYYLQRTRVLKLALATAYMVCFRKSIEKFCVQEGLGEYLPTVEQ